jgi:outer membrane protein insertion porin family
MDVLSKFRELIICLLLFSSFSLSAQKEYEVAAIRVEGVKTLDKSVIVSLSGIQIGQKFSVPGAQLSNAIKTLWSQNLFSDIDIDIEQTQGNKAFLLIKVEERPRISKYKIIGIKKSEIDEIRAKIDIKAGKVYNDNIKSAIKNTIRDYYIEKGFLYPTVDILDYPDTAIKSYVVLEIKINRGLKTKIDEINFLDNLQATDQGLRSSLPNNNEGAYAKIFKLVNLPNHIDNPTWNFYDKIGHFTPGNLWNYLNLYINPNVFKGSKYIPSEMKIEDRDAIRDHYATYGYRDAEVVWDTAFVNHTGKMDLIYQIQEGKRYYFRNIKWVGNTKYSDSLLNDILRIKKGDIYNATKLKERLFQSQTQDDISSLYMDDGYLFFRIDPVETAIIGDSVDVELRMYEGNQAVINKVNIFGNEKTNEKVIRRELRLLPGDKFDRSKLIRTQRELMALNYFNPEKIQPIPKPTADGNVDIDLILEEKPSDQFSISLGYANMFFGTVGLNFTNFSLRNVLKPKTWSPLPSGDGQTLSLNIQSSGLANQIFNVSFTEPWLGGRKPNSLMVNFTHSRFNQLANANTIIGSFIRTSGTVEFGTRLRWPDDYFVAQFGLTLENSTLNNYTLFQGINDGSINNFYGRFTLLRNSLQGPVGPQIFPTSGSNFSFSIQATLPYSKIFGSRNLDYANQNMDRALRWNWIEYHKWKFNMDLYTPIVGNLVVRFSSKFGTLGFYNSTYGISPFEKFRLGGDGLMAFNQFGQETYALRGYNDDEVTLDRNGQWVQGNTAFVKYTMELRYPLTLNPQSTIYALLFGEAGNGWESIRYVNPFEVKRSFGVGVRFFLPMFGLLGFDYGFGVDKNILESRANSSFIEKYGKFRFILGFEPQ